jgi:hypothetical protein
MDIARQPHRTDVFILFSINRVHANGGIERHRRPSRGFRKDATRIQIKMVALMLRKNGKIQSAVDSNTQLPERE